MPLNFLKTGADPGIWFCYEHWRWSPRFIIQWKNVKFCNFLKEFWGIFSVSPIIKEQHAHHLTLWFHYASNCKHAHHLTLWIHSASNCNEFIDHHNPLKKNYENIKMQRYGDSCMWDNILSKIIWVSVSWRTNKYDSERSYKQILFV